MPNIVRFLVPALLVWVFLAGCERASVMLTEADGDAPFADQDADPDPAETTEKDADLEALPGEREEQEADLAETPPPDGDPEVPELGDGERNCAGENAAECSGHGSCVAATGACSCTTGYDGPTCAACAADCKDYGDGDCRPVDPCHGKTTCSEQHRTCDANQGRAECQDCFSSHYEREGTCHSQEECASEPCSYLPIQTKQLWTGYYRETGVYLRTLPEGSIGTDLSLVGRQASVTWKKVACEDCHTPDVAYTLIKQNTLYLLLVDNYCIEEQYTGNDCSCDDNDQVLDVSVTFTIPAGITHIETDCLVSGFETTTCKQKGFEVPL